MPFTEAASESGDDSITAVDGEVEIVGIRVRGT